MARRYTGGLLSSKEQVTDANSASGIFSVQEAGALTAAGSFPTGRWTPQRSLRFRRSASAYLTRTPSVASGQNQWTLSTWVKRGVLGDAASQIIGGNTTTSGGVRNMLSVEFGSDNALWIYAFNNGSGYYFQRVSNQLFRDPSAWYHLVVQFDPDNAVSDSKVVAFVNGQRLTWSTSSDSGAAGNIGSSSYRSINNTFRNDINGGYQGGGAPIYFGDQYLSEMYMVSGSLVNPSSFIQTDPETGTLIPKQYTGTYGTNGFYLDFRDNTSTTNLALDRSGNGNNWTPNNISVSGATATTVSFTSVGTTSWTVPPGITSINYLVVAGGGAGGSAGPTMYDGGAAGGGAGGMLYGTLAVTPGTVYSVYVGAGASGAANRTRGASGDNSVLSSSSTSIVAIGGGGGGGGANTTSGANGGSGGGGANGGAAGLGTAGQGNNGGYYGGSPGNGGGGAGGVGGSATSNTGANGGAGLQWPVNSTTYAGGGGGGGYQLGGGSGGSSIGGNGGSNNSNGSSASASTGSGGGGSGGTYNTTGTLTGGSGANGIIIVSYATIDSTYDSMVDVPGIAAVTSQPDWGGVQRGNYPVLSPISVYNGGGTLSNGNLSVSYNDTANNKPTMGAISGKWYTEITCTSSGGYSGTGLSVAVTSTSFEQAFINAWYYSNGQTYNYGTDSYVSYGATWGTGDIIGVAWDCDNGNVTFYKNGVSQGLLTANREVRIIPTSTVGSAPYPTAYGTGVTSTFTINYGQRPFAYFPPAGFKSLCATNLPTPVIKKPSDHFDVKTYTGNGTALTVGTIAKQSSAYSINKSLRFRASASAYLNRTLTTPTSAKAWTFSAWVKRAKIGSAQSIFISTLGGAGVPQASSYFTSSDTIQIYDYTGSAYTFDLTTSQTFKDTSAWYHLVFVYDSAANSTSNRVRLYVNGTQITSFSSASFPSLNADCSAFNRAYAHYLSQGNAQYFDGYMAEVNFVDGQSLTPSSFGVYDANNNWMPQRYTGTYGTNGFYLPFNHNTTSSWAATINGSKYLTVPDSSVWAFSGNWTVEAFFNIPSVPGSMAQIVAQWVDGGGTDRAFSIGVNSVARLISYAQYGANQYYIESASGLIKINQWYHTALVANGSTLTLYLNGVAIGSSSITGTINNSTAPVGIGAYGNGSYSPTNVSISNVRITNTAVYTTNFTPPSAALTAISGTQLLTLQNSTFVDNSTNNFTITNVGSTTLSSDNPFILPSIVADQSGNKNNWIPNNFSTTAGTTYDSMFDSPADTVDSNGNVIGNYATLNPLDKDNDITTSNGNLSASTSTVAHNLIRSTIAIPSSGKWYAEMSFNQTMSGNPAAAFALIAPSTSLDSHPVSAGNYSVYGSSSTTLNSGATSGATITSMTSGQIWQFAVDADNNQAWVGLNNAWYNVYTSGATTGNPSTGTNPTFTGTMAGLFFGADFVNSSGSINFGQQPFAYTPPTGFKALNSKNLKDVGSYNLPDTFGNYVNTPDLVWIKNRTGSNNHALFDIVRGATQRLYTDSNIGNQVETTTLTQFIPNGFNVGSGAAVNTSTHNHVAWAWNRGKTPGFDIVTYAGNGVNGRMIPHNLGQVPAFYITKCLTSYNNSQGFLDWNVWHKDVDVSAYGGSKTLYLMQTTNAGAAGGYFANPTSSEFSPNQINYDNSSGQSYIAYLWAEVPGFSKMGSYTGNNSTNGPFVYTGFRPRWVMVKNRTSAQSWQLMDSARSTFNPATSNILPNSNLGEQNNTDFIDILSNGFRIRQSSAGNWNNSGDVYVYIAFAESPFKYANAR